MTAASTSTVRPPGTFSVCVHFGGLLYQPVPISQTPPSASCLQTTAVNLSALSVRALLWRPGTPTINSRTRR